MQRIILFIATGALATSAYGGGHRGLEPQHQTVVSGGVATVPGCPDWRDGELNAGTDMATNFGCATQMNLAAMIADPEDLIRGKSSPADPGETVRALKAWRERVPTGAKGDLEKVSSKGGQ